MGLITNPKNGPVIADPYVTLVYVGNDWAEGAGPQMKNDSAAFVREFVGSPVFAEIGQYGVNLGTVNPSVIDGGSVPSTIDQSAIGSYVDQGLADGTLPQNSLPVLVYDDKTTITLDNDQGTSCVQFMSFHSRTPNGIPYVAVPYPCNGALSGINGLGQAIAGELLQACTDDQFNAWQDYNKPTLTEIVDYCHDQNVGPSTLEVPGIEGGVEIPAVYSNQRDGCFPEAGSTVNKYGVIDSAGNNITAVPTIGGAAPGMSPGEKGGIAAGAVLGGLAALWLATSKNPVSRAVRKLFSTNTQPRTPKPIAAPPSPAQRKAARQKKVAGRTSSKAGFSQGVHAPSDWRTKGTDTARLSPDLELGLGPDARRPQRLALSSLPKGHESSLGGSQRNILNAPPRLKGNDEEPSPLRSNNKRDAVRASRTSENLPAIMDSANQGHGSSHEDYVFAPSR